MNGCLLTIIVVIVFIITMKGSGIDEALGQVYATNALPLILSGKAIVVIVFIIIIIIIMPE